MEELKHNDLVKEYPNELDLLRQADPDTKAVQVQIGEDYQRSLVKVSIGSTRLVFTVKQARDLAFEIRQSANRLERAALGQNVGRRKRR